MAKPNPIVSLAERLVRTLREQREHGSETYPITRSALAALAAPEAAAGDLAKAFRKKPFTAAFVFAHKSDPHSPIILAEDAERLAASSLLVEFALSRICTPQKPTHPPARAVKKIDKALQPLFATALERRLAAKDWPETVGVVTIKNKPHLYLKRMPPPPPPPATQLAAALLDTLHRLQQSDGYPLTLTQLVQRTDAGASPELVRQALKEKSFKPQVVLALANHLDSPLVLVADVPRLASSPLLLETVLAAIRTSNNQAVPAADLGKKLDKALRQPFAHHLALLLERGNLPASIGCLRIKTKPFLFLWKDTKIAAFNETPDTVVEMPVDFAQHFEEAFCKIDRDKGGSNFVSLVALRQALPMEHAVFDAGLDQLRRTGRYTLSSAEGRHGVSDEERAAGILEEGTLLLYVSRKRAE
jgi:hypothetical protein